MTTFKKARENFKKAQAERSRELNQKRKTLLYDGSESESEPFLEPQRQKSKHLFQKPIKIFNSEKN